VTSSQTNSAVTSTASTASTYYEPGQYGDGGIDTEGGASGSDAAAFRLSKGGLAAILIVVILVSFFGSKCDGPHIPNMHTDIRSRKHRALHRRQTTSMDHASDSHSGFAPSNWPFRSAQDTTDRNGGEQKVPTHWNPDG
jgi:hypothetical protein